MLTTVIEKAKSSNLSVVAGVDAFRLYDTYGFPFELTEEFAEEVGFTVDREGFTKEMESQRQRARAARQDVDSMHVQSGVLGDIHEKSEFIGYSNLQCEATVLVLTRRWQ